ncbi:MAG: potassium transporter Kup [Actinomycetota bacterium]|nr:potassium transporter Kup [Actinomycetota bacterium]
MPDEEAPETFTPEGPPQGGAEAAGGDGSSEAGASGPRGRHDGSRPAAPRTVGVAVLALGALGVVFGDIGTSPLYALKTVFTVDAHAVHTGPAEVYGVISLVFWAITLVVSIKYVTFVMRADNGGEGGIMALTALIQAAKLKNPRAKITLVLLGIFGASLFYGDGMITPAISVLSAVEGLKTAAPGVEHLILPITLVVLVMLFAIQSYGTGTVGRLFGPVMALWFAVLALAGGGEVLRHPEVLKALSPSYAVTFLFQHGAVAFIALGSVALAITGAEALYADMGHFGRAPIRRAWFLIAFPALTLNYLGQGSLILRSPTAIDDPFFLLLPSWSRIPMVLLATLATVIASQAVISGAFSVTRQAVQLGFLPRMAIRHTSHEEVGQVYAPAINWGLCVAVVALVLGFGSSAALASAYGVAVTGTFVLNTILFLAVVRLLWRKSRWMIAAGGVAFLVVEVALFTANLTKIPQGGWLPLAIALATFGVLTTWEKGRAIVTEKREEEEGDLHAFVTEIHDMDPPVYRPAGTAIFLNPGIDTTPLAMRENVEHNHVLHESAIIVSIEMMRVPHVPPEERLKIDDLGYGDDGISHIIARFGFQDDPDVPGVLQLADQQGLERPIDIEGASYFLSRITIVPTGGAEMSRWRKKLFLALAHNAADPAEYFALPTQRVVTMGAQIPL